jgi:predicted RNase H-related nuclease YkuK (DUF458 family)
MTKVNKSVSAPLPLPVTSDKWTQGNDPKQYTMDEMFDLVRARYHNPETITHVMVGTDSHSAGPNYHFVTVLCVWDEGKGGTYFYQSCFEPRKTFAGSQKMRLQDEVTKSLALAFQLEEKTHIKPEVHIDASPPAKKEFSSSFSDFLKGYVLSSGYDAILKPDSFVSNCIADKHTRKRVRGRKGQKHGSQTVGNGN